MSPTSEENHIQMLSEVSILFMATFVWALRVKINNSPQIKE